MEVNLPIRTLAEDFYVKFEDFIGKKLAEGKVVLFGNNTGTLTGFTMIQDLGYVLYTCKYLKEFPNAQNLQIYTKTGQGPFLAYDPPGKYRYKYPAPGGHYFLPQVGIGLDLVPFEHKSFTEEGVQSIRYHIRETPDKKLVVERISGQAKEISEYGALAFK